MALHEDEEKAAKSESKKYYVDMKIHLKLFFAFFLMRHIHRQNLRFNPNSVIHSDVLLLTTHHTYEVKLKVSNLKEG